MNQKKVILSYEINYIAKCAEFLTTFQDPALEDSGHGRLKYISQMVISKIVFDLLAKSCK